MHRIVRACVMLAGSAWLLAACGSMTSSPHPDLSAGTRLKLAEAADGAGDKDLALSMYTAAAHSDPGNVELQLRSVQAMAQAGKIAEARALLRDRLKENPRQPALLRAMALVDLVSGQPAQAITIFDQLLAASPGDVRLIVDKAVALDIQRRHADAQRLYRQALATNPDDPAIQNDLAMSLMLDGRVQEARNILVQLKDADAVPQRVKINLAIASALAGDVDGSHQLLQGHVSDGDLQKIEQALRQMADASTPPPSGQPAADATAKAWQ